MEMSVELPVPITDGDAALSGRLGIESLGDTVVW